MVILLVFAQSLSVIAEGNRQAALVFVLGESIQVKNYAQLEQIIRMKLEFYATQYPEINFIIFDSATDVSWNMQALAQVIGQDPVPLDYEHPEHLRETLLLATLERIEYLLTIDAGSATLFKPGKDAVATRKYACIITMNPWAIAKDDRAATRHLLEISDSDFDAIPSENYLDHTSHLQFTIDHEIFHCLDTIYNGGIPMSQLEFWGDYQRRKSESGADVFAIMMNMGTFAKVTPYARTLRNIRSLALLADDPNYYNSEAIDTVLKINALKILQSTVFERFLRATKIRNQVNGSYEDYINYKKVCYFATRLLTGEIKEEELSNEDIDFELLHTLVNNSRRAYRDLLRKNITQTK